MKFNWQNGTGCLISSSVNAITVAIKINVKRVRAEFGDWLSRSGVTARRWVKVYFIVFKLREFLLCNNAWINRKCIAATPGMLKDKHSLQLGRLVVCVLTL